MRSTVCSLFVMIWALAARPGDGSEVTNLTAVLGQSVTFRCPLNLNNPVSRLYIQKYNESDNNNEIFINGFATGNSVQSFMKPQYMYRTKVNQSDLSMEMTNISVSDEGLYKCVVFTTSAAEFKFYLKVTAEYSIPTVTEKCSPATGGKVCQLSCSSVGGYPQSTVRWAELNSSLMNNIHNKSFQDPLSKTWSINETISYSCSQPVNLRCSVGGAISHPATICKEVEEYFPLDAAVIIAIVVVLLLVLIVSSVYILKRCRRRRRRQVPGDPALEVPLADCHSQPQNS